MNQTAVMAVAAMLDQFGARGNPDLALASFEEVLRGVPDQIIVETASRFKAGHVEGQSLDFAPTSARFATEARRLAEMRRDIARPRLPAPDYHRSTIPPFIVNREKARAEYADWDEWETGITHSEFLSRVAQRRVPPGLCGKDWKYVARLNGTIFVPRKA